MLLKLNKEGPFKRDVFRAPGHQGNMRKLIHFLQQVSSGGRRIWGREEAHPGSCLQNLYDTNLLLSLYFFVSLKILHNQKCANFENLPLPFFFFTYSPLLIVFSLWLFTVHRILWLVGTGRYVPACCTYFWWILHLLTWSIIYYLAGPAGEHPELQR